MTIKKNDLISKTRLMNKAKEICEAKYQEAREYGELGLKANERKSVCDWCVMAENFTKLFECEEDFFFGLDN